MKPGQLPAQEPDGLFKTPLSRFIDMKHPLVQLPDKINWSYLEGVVGERFVDGGRPGVPVRFMVGMLILKATENLSDEMLFERWPCNPYYQYFTGELYFQHRVVHERSGMSHWRNRLGPDVLDQLLQESLRVPMTAVLCVAATWRLSVLIRRYRKRRSAIPRMRRFCIPQLRGLVQRHAMPD